MRELPSAKALIEGVIAGNRAALGKAITLVESNHPKHQSLAEELLSEALLRSDKAIRVGITGVPGVGKSTFIEALGLELISRGHQVAVLAVDPSSHQSQGSILGDKTRMQELTRSESAFIRPSPSGDNLGGVARKTRESMVLCEAAGYDVILVETMGVGQSEILVHSMVDFFLLLKLAGAGDELQGIKRGIMEMADSIVINKADGKNRAPAELAQKEFQGALHYLQRREDQWEPKVHLASALQGEGIQEIWELIVTYIRQQKESGFFERKRKIQQEQWFEQSIQDQLKEAFLQIPGLSEQLQAKLRSVQEHQLTPYRAAKTLVEQFLRKGPVE